MPRVVVAQASATLQRLEAAERDKDTQSTLFELPSGEPSSALEPEVSSSLEVWLQELRELDPDELSPKQALELVYRWVLNAKACDG
jgi:DNA mismatch repair protein MutS